MHLAPLQHLYTKDGPFVSVHLDVSRDTEDAAHKIETAWAETRAELEAAGAPGDVLEQIGDLLREPTHIGGESRRTLVADAGGVLFDDVRAGRGATPPVASYGALPDLTGWLRQVDAEVPFILVVTDREGADIEVHRAWSHPAVEHEGVEGGRLHITKVAGGYYAHKEYQRRSEELWRHNAEQVAETVSKLRADHKPRIVILAGDVRARRELHVALDHAGDVPVAEIEGGGRAAGSSQDALWEDALGVLARIADEERDALIEALGAAQGQGRPLARGLHDVLEALVVGRVERLVLDLDSAGGQTIDIHDYSGLELPVSAAQGSRLPALQVLVAAGAATDTELSLLPADVIGSDGVAGLLRWQE